MQILNKFFVSYFEKRECKKNEKAIEEHIKATKEIAQGITKELVKYNINFMFTCEDNLLTYKLEIGVQKLAVSFVIGANDVQILLGNKLMATYQTLKWYRYLPFCGKNSDKKQFYHTNDAVDYLSTMMITGYTK